ncbi:MAG: BlaI/MecI/CopY family transcriptional regulator [Deltaproteobacteria bacterium]|nr:BlaI/MecI/CopY family transcriptional regulator [Deltaproteobacteria bacterium]
MLRLGALEEAVLEHLFGVAEADVIETHEAVGAPRGITPNTVHSALERLCRKGLADRRKVSHAYRYRAALDRDAFHARKLVAAAGGIAQLRRSGLLAAFVDLVSESDARSLARLEQLVAAKLAERKRR